MRFKEYLNEKKKDARNSLYVGAKVKLLQGRLKGKSGKVVDLSVEDDQVDVKVGSKMSYVGFDDVELMEAKKEERGYTPGDIVKINMGKYKGKKGKVTKNLSYGKKEYHVEIDVNGKSIVMKNTEIDMVKPKSIHEATINEGVIEDAKKAIKGKFVEGPKGQVGVEYRTKKGWYPAPGKVDIGTSEDMTVKEREKHVISRIKQALKNPPAEVIEIKINYGTGKAFNSNSIKIKV